VSVLPAGARPRVLCVDDEPLVLDGLIGVLRRRFDVTTATSGSAGLQLLASAPRFDMIISDFQMPLMNGAEFLSRARERVGQAVRILLTGQASLEGAIDAVNQGGIFRFLTKPCPPATLLATVDEAAQQARLAGSDQAALAREVTDIGRLLLHAERLATLGTMVGAVGHELNNILCTYKGALSFVRESRAEGRPAEAVDLELLEAVGGHLQQHARQLLDLGRPQPASSDGIAHLNEVVVQAVDMLRRAGTLRHVELDLDLPAGVRAVRLDRTRAEQILVNLVKNAADACAELTGREGRVRVVVRADASRQLVTCHVEDNGVGIPEESLATIFEPYFTTKPSDRGTGLGLFVVKRILADAGGSIDVESRVGEGTTFAFSLPAVDAHA
jgi:signal transduction histidine kinase